MIEIQSAVPLELPMHLSERTRLLNAGDRSASTAEPRGTCVVYWMCTAVRSDENPALDVAVHAASELQLPLLVYHALSERYEYASDRHHMFVLQAARDVQRQLQQRGISYAFHLEQKPRSDKALLKLARQAAVVVTEDMPTGPQPFFLKALRRAYQLDRSIVTSAEQPATLLLAVDTACVVPMQLVGRGYDRAFEFRNKTRQLFAQRTTRAWPKIECEVQSFDLDQLSFEPLDLQSLSLPELISGCEIDHSIGPVLDTEGGSAAGYARWNAFQRSGLRSYAKKRNNAVLDGVSRMSPYLHYGMVSPMRIAREAAELDHDGAQKYLDELLIWRELAYGFCFYRADHWRLSAIPKWARETLQAGGQDQRPVLYSWEQMARGQTGDQLWDAAQKSLLIHGELHNNVRMTWGKAILHWTRGPKEALQRIIDLNHRYALDGRDPASYGGILWCLGQFDRPFSPPENILGTVRPRPTDQHAKRLDMHGYLAKATTSRAGWLPKTAVIGAGLSGAIAARTLADHGLPVTVFEKSRGAGGRMSTRRSELVNCDHGAQYFTARDPRFRRYVDAWCEQGLAAPWDGAIAVFENGQQQGSSNSVERYVAVPGMNALGKYLTSGLELRLETLVASMTATPDGWKLADGNGCELGEFQRLILAIPAPQAAALLATSRDESLEELARPLSSVELDPCWAVMATLTEPLQVDWNAAFVNSGPLRWISRDSTKPGRQKQPETLVLHASANWTKEHLECSSEQAIAALWPALWSAIGTQPQEPQTITAHRWRYSIPKAPLDVRCLQAGSWERGAVGEMGNIVACGDWAGGPRVEGAFLSGMAAAGRILTELPQATAKPPSAGQLELF